MSAVIDRTRLGLPVLSETSHEVVVIKPQGMPSELTSDPKGVSLIARLRSACLPPLDPKLPHRLDRVTRGVVVIALTPDAIAFHGKQIRLRQWEKYYLARVYPPRGGSIGTLLGQHKAYLKRVRHRAQIVHSGGKPAFLEILAACPTPERSGQVHLLVKLLTGRFHQIRVMMAGLDAPLVGDAFYGRDRAHRQARWRAQWKEFYLEHVVLKYVDFELRARRTAYLRDDPDREPIHPEMQSSIDALIE